MVKSIMTAWRRGRGRRKIQALHPRILESRCHRTCHYIIFLFCQNNHRALTIKGLSGSNAKEDLALAIMM
uniref:Uncharacterized protein n=1 Tax=Rhizophora mucronata TaxID=61149 RepID=A0A2P2MJT8_RHIMU